MRRYHITLGGQVFDVEILDDPRQDSVRVRVDGEILTVGVEAASGAGAAATASPPAPASAPATGAAAESDASSTDAVTAPLPGVVKSIAVQPDQEVTAGDDLVVIEAMKMDNVIRAPRAGTVGAIHVGEGRRVAHGAPLLDIEA